ncbi:MAG: hypothetical protein RLZ96_145, partial [Actinomycetota bacterium]
FGSWSDGYAVLLELTQQVGWNVLMVKGDGIAVNREGSQLFIVVVVTDAGGAQRRRRVF